MTITDRMSAALDRLTERWAGRRFPKAFYLGPADWAEFVEIADGQTVTIPFGNNPVKERTDPAFNQIPVRQSKGEGASRLYDHCSYGHPLIDAAGKPVKRDVPPVPAEAVFDALDKLSRTRALTDAESLVLEQAMAGRVVISRREAIRLGVKP